MRKEVDFNVVSRWMQDILKIRDGDELYSEWDGDPVKYEAILVQYLSAIRLADSAGKNHWLYGHNQIAYFLERHSEDTKLIEDLKKRLEQIESYENKLCVPFELEPQLTKAASYGNPWALKHLALYKLEKGEKELAKQLLEQAAEATYDSAYYELATHFYERGSEKWKELMQTASQLSYPIAIY